PELPARGPGAEMIGRTTALLVDLPTEIAPSGWQLASRPGRDLRRAHDLFARDLDALEQVADGYRGPLKVQVAGPWTLASGLELASGHKVVSDHGATRDLAQSLAEGLAVHLQDLARRVPGARLVVQVDEPGLNAVLFGRVPTPSGYGTVRSVDRLMAEQTLRLVLDVVPAGGRVVHSCERDVPISLFRAAGADAISLDASLLRGSFHDALAEAIEAGVSVWLGVVPSTDSALDLRTPREAITRLWRTLGFPAERLAASVVPTPTCGLAGASPDYIRRALTLLRELGADLLVDRE
ncbi:MAG: methionine synthase, partial [Actinomycetota bacterium]|nr:methionine synthase [Actinomycetota bacterium]